MSVSNNGNLQTSPPSRRKKRSLSPEKKYQMFLEAQSKDAPVGEILRREGLYSIDLTRIRCKVKEGALEWLSMRPGAQRKTVSRNQYDALKRELEEKERALAEQAVELAILRKKRMGVRGRDKRQVVNRGTEIGYPGYNRMGKGTRGFDYSLL